MPTKRAIWLAMAQDLEEILTRIRERTQEEFNRNYDISRAAGPVASARLELLEWDRVGFIRIRMYVTPGDSAEESSLEH